MPRSSLLQSKYTNSWAVVVGINDYQHVSPLGFACNDARGIAEALKNTFKFPEANVRLLLDEDATRANISKEILSLESCGADDRVIFFFAGHGHTKTGARGEIGFLVPFDGTPDDLSTLIRWNDLTANADLIPAKHFLFFMDACYGGLAVSRRLTPGSMRFAKDMLQRYSRQVLAAGKADEPVSDGGGPRKGHSIFTGHLLDALDGAANKDGIITANGVMSYVYERVSTDQDSRQTPHYGFLYGDGDLIFNPEVLGDTTGDPATLPDILIAPTVAGESVEPPAARENLKALLADPDKAIFLEDFAVRQMREALSKIEAYRFTTAVSGEKPTAETFMNRLEKYEASVRELIPSVALLAKWAKPEQRNVLELIFARLADGIRTADGFNAWLGLRWYPIVLLMYVGGIAALSSRNYGSLATILLTQVPTKNSPDTSQPLIHRTTEALLDLERSGLFKQIPAHSRNWAPRSEYLLGRLQPYLEDTLYLGTAYEGLFDRFEVFYALVSADVDFDQRQDVWGPFGRFAWKAKHSTENPFSHVVGEGTSQGGSWLPIQAGLFRGQAGRFATIAEGYGKLLQSLPWY